MPPHSTRKWLKLQTPAGKKLFQALQNYGAYVADDAGWDTHYSVWRKEFLRSSAPLCMIFRAPMAGFTRTDEAIQSEHCR